MGAETIIRSIFSGALPPGLEARLLQARAKGMGDAALLSLAAVFCLKELHDEERSLSLYHEALALAADSKSRGTIHYNIGCVQMSMSRYAQAVESFDLSIESGGGGKPLWNKCLSLLRNGDWLEGMRLFRSRRDPSSSDAVLFPTLPIPEAESPADMAGKTVIVLNEQGFGDELLFSRALPTAMRISRSLTVKCHPELLGLLQASMPDIVFFADKPPPTVHGDKYDCWTSTGDLFAMSCLSGTPFPPVHRLTTNASKPLPPRTRQRRIGVCWACNPKSKNHESRSFSPMDFEFLRKSDAEIFSFQKGAAAPDWMVDLGGSLATFDDTAALLKQMDLVIAADTAVANLAGAMGLPALLAHKGFIDWRWKCLDSDGRSRLYPSVRVVALDSLPAAIPEHGSSTLD